MNPNVDITSTNCSFSNALNTTFIETNGLEKTVNFTVYQNILTGETKIIKGYFKIPSSEESGTQSFIWNT
jgi:hypothetical protein